MGADSLANANAKHFDENIAKLGQRWPRWVLDLHQQITSFLTSPGSASWLGLPSQPEGSAMLDYACGNGVATLALHSNFEKCIGADVSAKMLEWYSATATALNLSSENMLAVRGDLTAEIEAETEPALPVRQFDFIAVCMALHHLYNPAQAISRLVSRHLKIGGTILVIDWTPMDDSTPAQRAYTADPDQKRKAVEALIPNDHAASHTISAPMGFPKGEMEQMLRQSGCNEFRWELAEELSYVEPVHRKGQLFFACARKS